MEDRWTENNYKDLRLLRKKTVCGYLNPVEAYLEADESTLSCLTGAEWNISYFSENHRKRIDSVMKDFGCSKYTLHPSIDECIMNYKKRI